MSLYHRNCSTRFTQVFTSISDGQLLWSFYLSTFLSVRLKLALCCGLVVAFSSSDYGRTFVVMHRQFVLRPTSQLPEQLTQCISTTSELQRSRENCHKVLYPRAQQRKAYEGIKIAYYQPTGFHTKLRCRPVPITA